MAKSIMDLFTTEIEILPHLPITLHHIGPGDLAITGQRIGKDLTGRQKLLLLVGAGGAGKTMFCRWAGERALLSLDAAGPGAAPVMITLDTLRPDLAEFFPPGGVAMPPLGADAARWFEQVLSALEVNGRSAIVNFGGDDQILPGLAREIPEFHKTMGKIAVSVIYCFTPRVADLNAMVYLENMGFQPETVGLLLNCGKAGSDPERDFLQLRHHPAYRTVLERGGIELWMPRHYAAAAIENRRIGFRAGASSLPVRDAYRSRHWNDLMETAMLPVISWLP